MEIYLYPVNNALLHFPIIAFVMTIPYMLYNYHRYGSVSILRSAILFSFVFYLLCAYYLVIFPLPNPASVAGNTGPYTQLAPFHFVRFFLDRTPFRLTEPGTWLRAIRRTEFFQPVFNVLLTLPFGVYLSYYFRVHLGRTVLLTFLLSLFFELTQLSGLYGLYPKPYRLFDVDDLMLNTLGGLIGYGVGARVGRILPSRRAIDLGSLRKSEHVSYTRRFVAFAIDGFMLLMASILIDFLVPSPYAEGIPAFTGLYLLYFVLLQALFGGRTPGKAFVNIRVMRVGTRKPLPLLLLIKYAAAYLPFLYVMLTMRAFSGRPSTSTQLILLASYLAIGLLALVDLILSFRRGRRTWYELLSRTMNVSVLGAPEESHGN